jgi:hypothetical protein
VAFEDFRQRLGACLGLRVAGRHAVADVEVADDIDREKTSAPSRWRTYGMAQMPRS